MRLVCRIRMKLTDQCVSGLKSKKSINDNIEFERENENELLSQGVNESDLDKTSRPRSEAVEPREQRDSVVLCQTVSLSPSAHRSLSLQTFISSPFLFHLLLSKSVCHCSDYYAASAQPTIICAGYTFALKAILRIIDKSWRIKKFQKLIASYDNFGLFHNKQSIKC